MHSPPPVRYPVGRSRAAERLLTVVWTAGAACVGTAAILLAMSDVAGWRSWLPCGAAVLAGLSAWHFGRRAVEGRLVFDGGCWWLRPDAGVDLEIGQPRIRLDLQRLVLVQVSGRGRLGHWMWVDRAADPSRWLDLRRALFAAGDSRTDPPSASDGGKAAA